MVLGEVKICNLKLDIIELYLIHEVGAIIAVIVIALDDEVHSLTL